MFARTRATRCQHTSCLLDFFVRRSQFYSVVAVSESFAAFACFSHRMPVESEKENEMENQKLQIKRKNEFSVFSFLYIYRADFDDGAEHSSEFSFCLLNKRTRMPAKMRQQRVDELVSANGLKEDRFN